MVQSSRTASPIRIIGLYSPAVVGVACGILAAALWGGGAVVTRFLITNDLGIYDLVLLRYLGAFPIVAGLLAVFPSRLRWEASWEKLALLVLLAGPPYHLLVIAGYAYATAGGGALLMSGLLPVFALIFAAALGVSVVRRTHLLGAGLIICSVWLVAISRPDQAAFPAVMLPGYLIFATAAALWALCNQLVQKWCVDPLRLMVALMLSAPLFLPAFILLGPGIPKGLTWSLAVIQLGYHGVLVGLVATLLFFIAVRRAGSQLAASIQALAPVFAIGFGIAGLNEQVSVVFLIGAAAMIIGIVLAA